MNAFKEAMDSRGITYLEASRKGIPYQTIRKHYMGLRRVSAESALVYERVLGIPKSEIRPDLWAEIPG